MGESKDAVVRRRMMGGRPGWGVDCDGQFFPCLGEGEAYELCEKFRRQGGSEGIGGFAFDDCPVASQMPEMDDIVAHIALTLAIELSITLVNCEGVKADGDREWMRLPLETECARERHFLGLLGLIETRADGAVRIRRGVTSA